MSEDRFSKKTPPYLTRYERAKVIGVRAEQISVGQVPLIEDVFDGRSALDLAIQELIEKKIPNKIIRKLPNGDTETWLVKDLINLYDQPDYRPNFTPVLEEF